MYAGWTLGKPRLTRNILTGRDALGQCHPWPLPPPPPSHPDRRVEKIPENEYNYPLRNAIPDEK